MCCLTMTKKKKKKDNVTVISWCCSHNGDRSLENLIVIHVRKCLRLSANVGYLVISSLFLLNVAHQRVHQAGHLSHFLSRPLVHRAQIPINRQTHRIHSKPKLKLRGYGIFGQILQLYSALCFELIHFYNICWEPVLSSSFFSLALWGPTWMCLARFEVTQQNAGLRPGMGKLQPGGAAFWSSFAISLLCKVIMWPFNRQPLLQFAVMYE